jgi:hypothetical protein
MGAAIGREAIDCAVKAILRYFLSVEFLSITVFVHGPTVSRDDRQLQFTRLTPQLQHAITCPL